MNSINRYSKFINLQQERLWPINTTQSIQQALVIARTFTPPFVLTCHDIVTDPELREKLGYNTQEDAARVYKDRTFFSPSHGKCWCVFEKVVIGAPGAQTIPQLALEVHSGDLDVRYLAIYSEQRKLKHFYSAVECIREFVGTPNILQYKAHYFSRSPEGVLSSSLFAEFCPNGDLLGMINNGIEVTNAIPQLLSAVKSLHDRNVIHRDIKLENIFISEDGELVIGDFGFACKEGASQELIASPCYCPLFEATDRSFALPITKKMDIWAVGLVIYAMVYRKLPSYTMPLLQKRTPQISMKDAWELAKSQFPFFYEQLCNSPINNYLKQFFVYDPAARPGIDQIEPLHAFFPTIRNFGVVTSGHNFRLSSSEMIKVAQEIATNHRPGAKLMLNERNDENKEHTHRIRVWYKNYTNMLFVFEILGKNAYSCLGYNVIADREEVIHKNTKRTLHST